MVDQPSDTLLVERIATGDKSAMRALYGRYADPLGTFVNVRFLDPTEAADVVHDAFLDVWRTAGRFEGRSTVKSWIFSIARNKAIDRIRRASRVTLTETEPEVPDEAPDPFEVTAAMQDTVKLRECIGKLSDSHRTAIHLAFFEDLAYSEIAEIEGCAMNTVKTRIFHAKKLLMQCITRAGASS